MTRPATRPATTPASRTVTAPHRDASWSLRPPRAVLPFAQRDAQRDLQHDLVLQPAHGELSRLVLAVATPERRWVLRRTFERTGLVEVVAEVGDGSSCLEAVWEHAPDAAVVELGHHDAEELRLVRLVSQAGARPSVVVLADLTDPLRLEMVLRSGAVGAVRRDAPPYDVVRQVHAVLGLPFSAGSRPEPA